MWQDQPGSAWLGGVLSQTGLNVRVCVGFSVFPCIKKCNHLLCLSTFPHLPVDWERNWMLHDANVDKLSVIYGCLHGGGHWRNPVSAAVWTILLNTGKSHTIWLSLFVLVYFRRRSLSPLRSSERWQLPVRRPLKALIDFPSMHAVIGF